ncbi:hypothetical protein D3C81_1927570 [compost metagenome]
MARLGHAAVAHGRVVHAALLHGQHFLLMPGMHGGIAQVELMGQLALVGQHETHRLPGLDRQ